jgi:hypothetical protein
MPCSCRGSSGSLDCPADDNKFLSRAVCVSTVIASKRTQRTRVSCIALALPTPSGDSMLLSASIEDEGIRESRGGRTSSRYGRPFKVSYWRLVYRVADQMTGLISRYASPIESEYDK